MGALLEPSLPSSPRLRETHTPQLSSTAPLLRLGTHSAGVPPPLPPLPPPPSPPGHELVSSQLPAAFEHPTLMPSPAAAISPSAARPRPTLRRVVLAMSAPSDLLPV
ncbi:Hypothetical protein CAP_2373 [Chondromyces apiculatus DSM 436]|uniref:Uncharacterized protein n=1 Tax=Chondromyces apiculatus DSM 436 TaxID=1192034 RepID=A0A017TA83_9BACT|nr:Hypothetical protein CAP_2373 [Chondromyces apiculatus DSM 436]